MALLFFLYFKEALMAVSSPYYRSRQITVCFDCERRQIGCHADCEVYKEAKKESEERKAKAHEERKKELIGFSNNKARYQESINRWNRNYGV